MEHPVQRGALSFKYLIFITKRKNANGTSRETGDKNFQFFYRYSACSICGSRLAGQVLQLSVFAFKKFYIKNIYV